MHQTGPRLGLGGDQQRQLSNQKIHFRNRFGLGGFVVSGPGLEAVRDEMWRGERCTDLNLASDVTCGNPFFGRGIDSLAIATKPHSCDKSSEREEEADEAETIDIHRMDSGQGVEKMEIHRTASVSRGDGRQGGVLEELSLHKV
jgi:hypothetical protein